MKQSLQLKIGQQLTMTPQLQQAIRLLQLSTLDLQQEIQQALDSNPLLEISEEEAELPGNDGNADTEADAAREERLEASTNSAETGNEESRTESDDHTAEDSWNEEIPQELSTDSSWDDTYQTSTTSSAPARDDDWEPGDNDSLDETLQDHLIWQLNLTPMSDSDPG